MSDQIQALQEKLAGDTMMQMPFVIARLENALKIQTTATLTAAIIQALIPCLTQMGMAKVRTPRPSHRGRLGLTFPLVVG